MSANLQSAHASPGPMAETRGATEAPPLKPAQRILRRENLLLRLFAMAKIPLIGYVRPKVVAMDEEKVVVAVPLKRRNQNHHGTMYFGALAIGADLAAGLAAMRTISDVERRDGHKISFVFKDVQGTFLRRPDGDVHFRCAENKAVEALVAKAIQSGEREELSVAVTCTVPEKTGDEPVATFVLTISIKKR